MFVIGLVTQVDIYLFLKRSESIKCKKVILVVVVGEGVISRYEANKR